MSVKAQALVWDLECPKRYGEVSFKPSHKYALIAYADHADHNGKNIYPAVATIASKTGLDERTIQRLTNDLETIGLLIEDGQGPKGTNRWKLPYNDRGDKLTPLTNCRGDKKEKSLGDIPSGDIPSGDNLTPELNEPEPLNNELVDSIIEILRLPAISVFSNDFHKWLSFEKLVRRAQITIEENVLVLSGYGQEAAMYEDRYARSFNNQLVVNQRGGFTSLTFAE